MSIDVYLQCFGELQRTGIARTGIRPLFPIVAADSEYNRWRVRYDDWNFSDVYVSPIPTNPEFVASISINRPCGDIRLWEAMFRILQMGSVFLNWPDGPLVVASTTDSSDLDSDVIEGLGDPRSVTTGEQIRRLIEEG